MVQLRSAAALGTTELDSTTNSSPKASSPERADSDNASLSSSSSSTSPISYDESHDHDHLTINGKEYRTTRQKVDRRPPSTFWKKSWKEQNVAEKLCNLATCPDEMHILQDEGLDRGPVPSQSIFSENWFILTRGLVPIVLQQASYWAFPNFQWPAWLAWPIYFHAFIFFALQVVSRLNYYCVKLGTFDEKNIGRDRTPDKSVNGLAKGILLYMIFRTALPFYLHYNKATSSPLTDFTWTYPLRLGAWQLTLDYFFYVYHRSCHEIDFLWGIHKHHHTTKHPTAILAILAEDRQECLEIALIPTLASLLVPMTFSELYLTMCYTIYVEMLGHSGVRANWPHPILTPVLSPFEMELAVEDHDLHHRFGKSGKNYGKQSRFWDRIYGTVADRIETYGF